MTFVMELVKVTIRIELQQLFVRVELSERLYKDIYHLIKLDLNFLSLLFIEILVLVGTNSDILGAHLYQELVSGGGFDQAHHILDPVTVGQAVIGEGVDLLGGDDKDNVLGHGQLVKLDHVAFPLDVHLGTTIFFKNFDNLL